MPYSRKRKTYSRRRGAALGAGATQALNRVARAMYMSTDMYKEKKRKRAVQRAFRKYNASTVKGLDDMQYAAEFDELHKYNPDVFAPPMSQQQLMKLIGKGGYWGRKIGGWLGGLTGNSTIKGWGEKIGDYAGDLVADKIPGGGLIADAAANYWKARGTGAYTVGAAAGVQPGTFAAGDVEQVHLQHREFLGPVQGSAAFSLTELLLNPGSAATFPQLSKIAMFYEQYRFNGLIFWYHSTSGESTNSADTAIGEVMMANMPDSTEQSPINKQQLVRLDMAKQAKPSIDQMHGIECADALVKYIRHGDKSEATQDAARFDMGKFFIATEGMNASTTRIGELWVTYDVTLIRSRDSKGSEVMCANYTNALALNTNLFATAGLTRNWDNIGLTFVNLTNKFYFPQYVNDGDYLLTITCTGTEVISNTFNGESPMLNTGACQNITLIGTDNDYSKAYNQALTVNDTLRASLCSRYAFRINAPGPQVAAIAFWGNTIFPATGAGAASGTIQLRITKIPQGFFP